MAGLACRTIGSQGPALVLVHGFGGSREVWADVQAALADRATTYAHDLPGHAGSLDFQGAGPPRVAAEAILADMAARGVDRFHLAGHSLGGAVATLMAMAAPARIASLTLLAPGGFGPEINIRLLRRFARATEEAEIEAVLETMVGFLAPVPRASIEQIKRSRSLPGQVPALIRFAEAMVRDDGHQGVIPTARVNALPMPVTVLWGEQDHVLPCRSADGLAPPVRVLRIAETGHMLIEEAHDAVVAVLAEQIAGPAGAPQSR